MLYLYNLYKVDRFVYMSKRALYQTLSPCVKAKESCLTSLNVEYVQFGNDTTFNVNGNSSEAEDECPWGS